MKKTLFYRWFFYLAGLFVLALGITLNTKAGLGVAPIISVSYSISTILNRNFGNMTLLLYSLFVLVEILLHTLRFFQNGSTARKNQPGNHVTSKKELAALLLKDALQFPLSLVFTRFLNIFSAWIPTCESAGTQTFYGSSVGRFCVLLFAIILTGIGAAMSLNMRIIPNPGDGIVQAISDCIGKSVGFTKNCFDLTNVTITTCVGLLFAGKLIGIGIGTVLAVIGVGRTVAVFNHFCMEKMAAAAGM